VLPDTRVTLLQRLPDAADAEAWETFVKIYAPVIFGFAVRRGCPASEARDLVQEVLIKVASAIRSFEYDRSRGRFRNWLFTIARNQLESWRRKINARPKLGSDAERNRQALERKRDKSVDPERIWQMEYQRQVVYRALPVVKEGVSAVQWRIFHGLVIDDRSASEMSIEEDMSIGAVYVAKSRVLARLREEIDRLERRWEAEMEPRGDGRHLPEVDA